MVSLEIVVYWIGLDRILDYVIIIKLEDWVGVYINYKYIKDGNFLKICMFNMVGDYEVCYMLSKLVCVLVRVLIIVMVVEVMFVVVEFVVVGV